MEVVRLSKAVTVILLCALTSIASADPGPSNNSKLAVLKDIAEAIGSLGDAIVKITDGVKHLVETSTEGVSFVLAETTKSRLKDLSARSTQFSISQNVMVTQSIDDYLRFPTASGWEDVKSNISTVLIDGKLLLDDWHDERSDFVLEDAYAELNSSLSSRLNLLQKLGQLPPPTTPDELEALSQINVQYKRLIEIFKNAVKELNKYLKHDFA